MTPTPDPNALADAELEMAARIKAAWTDDETMLAMCRAHAEAFPEQAKKALARARALCGWDAAIEAVIKACQSDIEAWTKEGKTSEAFGLLHLLNKLRALSTQPIRVVAKGEGR